MKLIEQLREQLRKVGAKLDDGDYALHCDAPSGYVWLANGMPSFTIHYATNRQTWLAQAIKEEMPNLKMGLEKVTDETELKEHRHNLDDDTWGAKLEAPQRIEWPA